MRYQVELFNQAINVTSAEDLEKILNEQAGDGWELVHIIPQIGSTYSISDGEENIRSVDAVDTASHLLIFKR